MMESFVWVTTQRMKSASYQHIVQVNLPELLAKKAPKTKCNCYVENNNRVESLVHLSDTRSKPSQDNK